MQEGQMPPEQAPAGGGEESLAQGIAQVGEALSALSQGLAKANPQLAERMQAVVSEYQAIVSELAQGGAPAPQQSTGMVSPEGGAAGVPLPQ